MKDNKVFCEECREYVDFEVKKKQLSGKIKNKTYNYVGKVAYCKNCKSEIYVNEINDFNLRVLYDKYREDNNIISLKEISEICTKYNIGKRPLSLLLGWGEQTFSRYYDGDIPTKQYSDVLKKIYNDPYFYNSILEENKSNLKSESAYRKSKERLEEILGKSGNVDSKINLVIGYLLNKCGEITPLALQKSLYYIQGFHYAFNERFLFEEDCEAWAHGPVYPKIYHMYKDYKFDPIEKKSEFNVSVFKQSEIEILDSVIKNLCCYSGKVLEEFTHSESPWLNARDNLKDGELSNNVICKDDIGKYFIGVKENYNMINPSDIKFYSQELFKRI